MIVNKASIQAFFATMLTVFNKQFENTETTWQTVASEIPSTGANNTYSWFAKFPKMRRWFSEKTIKALKAYKYVLENYDFEATVEVDRNDLDDGDIGQYKILTQGAAKSAKEHPEELINEASAKVFTEKCFDGQYMVDTDHEVAGASVSNKLTVALSHATLAAAQASYGAAKTAMRGFKDEEGRSLRCRPTVLEVSTALEDTAKVLMGNDELSDGTKNPYKGDCVVRVNPDLGATEWMILDTSQPIKPFIYQNRKKPTFVSMQDLNSDSVFHKKKLFFGVESRGNAGYSFWQLIVGSTGAG